MNRTHWFDSKRRRVIAALVAGAAVLLVAGLATLALTAGRGTAARPTPSPSVRPVPSPSPSASASARPTPTPTRTPTPVPAQAYEALVVVPGVQSPSAYYVYDSTTGQARRVDDHIGGLYGDLRFAPGDRLSVTSYSQILSMDRDGGGVRTEAAVQDEWSTMAAYGWSRSGTLAYLLVDARSGSGGLVELVMKPLTGPQTRVSLGILDPGPAGARVRVSPDGTKVLVQVGGVQVRRLDGTLLFAAPDGTLPAAQATWSADGRLYYSDGRGIVAVDPSTGATRIVLPGMRWYNPDTAPDGRRIVFELRDGQGVVRLQLLDVASGQVDSGFVRAGGRKARFVSPTELWFHEQDQYGAPLVAFDLLRRSERMVGMAGQLTDARLVPTS